MGVDREVRDNQRDIRDLPDDTPRFDLITLVNLVYYFPVEQRPELFRVLRSRLAPGGSLAIVMNMQEKMADFGVANLNMANASMQWFLLLVEKIKHNKYIENYSSIRWGFHMQKDILIDKYHRLSQNIRRTINAAEKF